jgi:hypothetical protein
VNAHAHSKTIKDFILIAQDFSVFKTFIVSELPCKYVMVTKNERGGEEHSNSGSVCHCGDRRLF